MPGSLRPAPPCNLGNNGQCNPSSLNGSAAIDLTSAALAAIPGLPPLPNGSITLNFSAIYAVCTAGPASGTTGFSAASTIANGTLSFNLPAVTLPPPLPSIPAFSQTFPFNGSMPFNGLPAPFSSLVNIKLNQTSPTGPTTSATSLELTLLGGTVLDLKIGAVTCGPNGGPLAPTTTTPATTAAPAAQTSPSEVALSGIQTDEGRYVPARQSSTNWLFWGGLATVSVLVLGGIIPLKLRRRANR